MTEHTFITTYVASTCNHCWHSTGSVLLNHPDQKICCNCGQTMNVRMVAAPIDRAKHGVYLP